MELSEFVSESIKQIIMGVVKAQAHAEGSGAIVNPRPGQPSQGKGITQGIVADVALLAIDSVGAAMRVIGGRNGHHHHQGYEHRHQPFLYRKPTHLIKTIVLERE